MVMMPQIFTAKVMHKRLFPKENSFAYGVYYLALPLPVAEKQRGLVRFDATDVGKRDGSDPEAWVRGILHDYHLNDICRHIILVTMPRVFFYVFNPVSFYLCLDGEAKLRAVLCEVHNTFGEQHCYLCANQAGAPILANQWLASDKIFHVSPFLPRTGHYKFRFNYSTEKLAIWIDYCDESGQKQLLTSLIGRLSPMNATTLRQALWRHPWVTLKTIYLIHWQALRLLLRGISYFTKPSQLTKKISPTIDLEKH